jgi:hypothetical protein
MTLATIMAGSFSIYQGPVPEWTKLVQTTGFENPDVSGLTPLQLRAKTNTGRVEAARAIIKAHSKLRPNLPRYQAVVLMRTPPTRSEGAGHLG